MSGKAGEKGLGGLVCVLFSTLRVAPITSASSDQYCTQIEKTRIIRTYTSAPTVRACVEFCL